MARGEIPLPPLPPPSRVDLKRKKRAFGSIITGRNSVSVDKKRKK
jgi:hypothetical protein